MTRRRSISFAVIGVFTAVILYGGVSGLFGPRMKLEVSGQLSGGPHGAAVPATTNGQGAVTTIPVSGVATSAARVLTTVSVEPAKKETNGYAIEARVVGKDGKALPDTEVAFYDVVALLGPREMLIGTAKTDGFGIATVNYLPPQGGTHTINVRPVRWDVIAATQASTKIEAARVAPIAYARERLPLDPFSVRLPSIGAVVVLAVWLLFALIVLGTAYLIPRGARRSPYMGNAREI